MSITPPVGDRQGESGSDNECERCMHDLTVEEELCEVCVLLDLPKVFFGSGDYELPVTKANLYNRWHNRFCWFLEHIRKNSGCLLCRMVHQALRCTPSFDSLEDGIVIAWRSTMYSQEKDESLPNFYVLSLGVSEGNELGAGKDYGIAIGVLGSHQMKLRNSRDECLRHFYPYLAPGMLPIFTTDEQAKLFDEWRDQTGSRYSVSLREINQFQVSMDLISGWLRACEQEHVQWCRTKLRQDMAIPNFRVIDVANSNIIPGPPNCRYLALSYVWGKVHENTDSLRLAQGNHTELDKPGALVRHSRSLPDTIKDAILLCVNLNERYLWIDSLCIIQDSPAEQKEQMSKMDSIYSRAALTIVAAAGDDANAGLPGLRSSLPRRSIPAARIQSLDLIALPQDGEFEVNSSRWNTRAWTFQERLLSTRLLRFTQSSITFECLEACWREDMEVEGRDSAKFRLVKQERQNQEIRGNLHQIISDDTVDFQRMVPREKYGNVFRTLFQGCYSPLVRDYTKRQLTNEKDILDAFGGIQTALSRSLGPFSWGLPQHLLAQSLVWIAKTEDMSSRCGFPSWAWAGWVFEENNQAIYGMDIHGPNPGFSILSDDGQITYWSSECVNNIYIGIYEWHDSLLYPENNAMAKEWDEIMQATVEDVMSRPDEMPLSSLVFFWTSTVPIQTGKDGRQPTSILNGTTVVRMFDNDGVSVGGGLEEHEFLSIVARPLPSYMELAYLGSGSSSGADFCLILIRWTDGIARRILPQVLFGISAEDWEKAKPQRNFIILA